MIYDDLTEEKIKSLSDEELIENHSKIVKTSQYFNGVFVMFDNEMRKRHLSTNYF